MLQLRSQVTQRDNICPYSTADGCIQSHQIHTFYARQKGLTQCGCSYTVSGLQYPGQIRAQTDILWYVLLRACSYGETASGVMLALTSSFWSMKRMRSRLCMCGCIYMWPLRQGLTHSLLKCVFADIGWFFFPNIWTPKNNSSSL